MRILLLLLALVTAVASCALEGDEMVADAQGAEGCPALISELVEAAQGYVDGLTRSPALESTGGVETSGDEADLLRLRRELREADCDAEEHREQLAAELDGIRAEGPLGAAAAASLRTGLLAEEGDAPRTVRVSPGDDLAAALARADAGATVLLEAGEHTVDEPLLLLHPLTIVGDGRDDTSIVSSAGGVAFTYLGERELHLEGVSLVHDGSTGAAVAAIRSGGYVLRGLRLTGATLDLAGAGGSGLILGSEVEGPPGMGPTRWRAVVEDVVVDDNEVAGIAVVGREAPQMRGLEVRGNGACGVCYLGTDGGTLRDSELSDNEVGVAVASSANPRIENNRVEANEQFGVTFEDGAGGLLRGNDLRGSTVGVWVSGRAEPTLESNTLEDSVEAAVVFGDDTGGRAAANVCVGVPHGIVLVGSADPTLESSGCGVTDERGAE